MALLGAPTEMTPQNMVQALVAVMSHLVLPKFNDISERLSSFEQRTVKLEEKLAVLDRQNHQLSVLETECKTLKEKNAQLEDALQRVAEVAFTNKRHSYQFNLLLHGVKEDHPDLHGATDARDPGFRRVVLAELAKFDPSITDADFEKAHRLGPPRPEMSDSRKQAPRAILIRFYNRYRKEKLLEESIRRHKLRKTVPGAEPTQRDPYLTGHRVRDSIAMHASALDMQMDTQDPPDPQRSKQVRRENKQSTKQRTSTLRVPYRLPYRLRQREGNN